MGLDCSWRRSCARRSFRSQQPIQVDGGDAEVQPLLKAAAERNTRASRKSCKQATMALYKEYGVNPLAGCFPMLIQLPILLGVLCDSRTRRLRNTRAGARYAAIAGHGAVAPGDFWTGFCGSAALSHALSANFRDKPGDARHAACRALRALDVHQRAISAARRSSDPQQAQTQKIMAIDLAGDDRYFGWRYRWASALLIYWLSLNVLTMAQQFYMYRRNVTVRSARRTRSNRSKRLPSPATKHRTPALTGGSTR